MCQVFLLGIWTSCVGVRRENIIFDLQFTTLSGVENEWSIALSFFTGHLLFDSAPLNTSLSHAIISFSPYPLWRIVTLRQPPRHFHEFAYNSQMKAKQAMEKELGLIHYRIPDISTSYNQ